MTDVLCVGAHPDDIEIGMGGTVAGMVRRGSAVAFLDLTDGEPTPHGTPHTRVEEARRAAEALGVEERITLDLPNRSLADTPEARAKVAEVIRRLRPDVMFVPFAEDAHPDHMAACALATAARFQAKYTKTDMAGEPHYVRRLYQHYAVHLRTGQTPSFVVDVTEDLDSKREALECYESQFTANPANRHVIEMVLDQARYWGSLIGAPFGEPFASPEMLAVGCPSDLA